MIPLKYNVRNLRVRWLTTLKTVLGTGLVVWASVLTFGLTDGLEHALSISSNDLDLIVLRQGPALQFQHNEVHREANALYRATGQRYYDQPFLIGKADST